MEAGTDAGPSRAGGAVRQASTGPVAARVGAGDWEGVGAVRSPGPAQRPEVGAGTGVPPTTPVGPDSPGRRARLPGSPPQAPPGLRAGP